MAKVLALAIIMSFFSTPTPQNHNQSCEALAKEDCMAMDLTPSKCRVYTQEFLGDCKGNRLDD